ncbi:hypothetical protein [Floridanema flaviceps]
MIRMISDRYKIKNYHHELNYSKDSAIALSLLNLTETVLTSARKSK